MPAVNGEPVAQPMLRHFLIAHVGDRAPSLWQRNTVDVQVGAGTRPVGPASVHPLRSEVDE